jgi:Zn-dependent alcohol dehydrogenase
MCGKGVLTVDYGDRIESEFMDSFGRCWDCSNKAAKDQKGRAGRTPTP